MNLIWKSLAEVLEDYVTGKIAANSARAANEKEKERLSHQQPANENNDSCNRGLGKDSPEKNSDPTLQA